MVPVVQINQLVIALIGLVLMLVPSIISLIFKVKSKYIILIINLIMVVLGILNPMITAIGWSALLVFIIPPLLRNHTSKTKKEHVNTNNKDELDN